MSGPPRMRSLNCAESDSRPVLGPAGNKARTMDSSTKQLSKPQRKVEKAHEIDESKSKKPQSLPSLNSNPSPPQPPAAAARFFTVPSSLSLNASSCSSDASSSDSPQSRASSTGRRMSGRSVTPIRRKQCGPKRGAVEKVVTEANGGSAAAAEASVDSLPAKKRCAWVTTNTDPCYAAFHDEEWGVPVHDDKKLFELLIFSTALAELSWPAILSKRHMFREVFLEFDPIAVSKLNEKKVGTPGTPGSSLLSEVKLRAIIENARQMCKITDEFGSFDNYIWGFVNHKPTVSQFRYPRQVPIKTSKADMISKDLVRRGFRGVGPTVVYSFMQVAGMTNDHLISCFRFHECVAAADAGSKDGNLNGLVEEKQHEDSTGLGLARGIDDLSLLATE